MRSSQDETQHGDVSVPDLATFLRFDGLSKVFPDGTVALDGIDLHVNAGEFVSLVGPSGCGKSTLLRLASGLIAPTAGVVTAPPPRTVGYVFQEPTLLPWRTVQANVELLSELHHVPRGERRRRAAAVIELVGLSGFEHHHPPRLSAGMRMRVSLARSLMLQPTLFLFDEPFAALDEITRERLNDELMRLYVSQRFAGMFVTHSVIEAAFLGSRVVVMSPRPGRLIDQITIPFGFPRPSHLRYDPEFTRVVGGIKETLRRGSR